MGGIVRATAAFRAVRLVALSAVSALATFSGAGADAADRGRALSYRVEERSIPALQADMAAGRITSEALVRAYLSRIAALDRSGPELRSVLAINPKALDQARALDRERARGHVRGPLHGVPILLKDNIETADPVATTAGSLALRANFAARDAALAARLRAAGAVILGKTNLSEWANFRSSDSISGWSAVGGLVKNPYALDRSACGSSAGSAVAASASLAAASVGTETDGSITCPASMAGVVGLKPTRGLVSGVGIVPISPAQDTAGPMGRSVADVAALLSAIAEGPAHDYAAGLRKDALAGKRLGVPAFGSRGPAADALFARTLARLRAAGAVIVPIHDWRPDPALDGAEHTALLCEFKTAVNGYLAGTPAQVKARTLADLIAFDAQSPRELALFGQDTFEAAEATAGAGDHACRAARATAVRLAGPEGLDPLFATYRLDALIAPTRAAAFRIDIVDGDHFIGAGFGSLAAVSGAPHLTVPLGAVQGLPVGLSFIGPAGSDGELLAMGYAFEQAAAPRTLPTYRLSIESSHLALASSGDPSRKPGHSTAE